LKEIIMTIHKSTRVQAYQLHKGGTPARMAILRMIAADSANNCNELTRLQPGDWRGARHYKLNTYEAAFAFLSQGSQDGEPVWYAHVGDTFRDERDAHTIVSSLGRGWFTDGFCDETAIGIVARLTHSRFIAGYRWTLNDERVYFPDIFDDEEDAACMADGHAEAYAEQSREYEESERERMAREEEENEERERELAVGESS
jgi:signal transduction histidine kinase